MRPGFQIPGLPRVTSAGGMLAVAMIASSLLHALVFHESVLLVPGEVFNLALWRPLTWTLVANDPMEVIFGALILWSIGGGLEQTWGRQRMLTFALVVTFVSGLLTLLVAVPFTGIRQFPFTGATVMTTALWVAYGLSWGERRTNFWGLPVTGNVLALIGVGFVVLTGAYARKAWPIIIPSAFGLVMTYLYVKLHWPTRLFERFGSWRLQRELARRKANLSVLSGDKRNMPSDSDRYLH